MLFDLLEPVLNVIESSLVTHVIHQQYAHCPLVVSLSNRSESFLASCIPDLELYAFVSNVDGLNSKVYSDGRHVGGWKLVIRKP